MFGLYNVLEVAHEYKCSVSCKCRWFCPSCHAKKVVQFGESLRDNILYPVPHKQYVFSIPIMLLVYFNYDRALLTRLCHCAYESLLIFLRNTTGLADGVPGVVMSIHSFGDYPDKFQPHKKNRRIVEVTGKLSKDFFKEGFLWGETAPKVIKDAELIIQCAINADGKSFTIIYVGAKIITNCQESPEWANGMLGWIQRIYNDKS